MPGDPVVLYNIWDVGSALAVVAAAPRRWPPAATRSATRGFGDGEQVPLDFVFANARRIVAAVDPLPLTVDFEGAYSTDPEEARRNVARLAETGAVGCNFEDQVIGGEGVHPLDLQCRRIEAIRRAVGDDFFINARTDLYLKAKDHDDALVDQVIERGKAFADAGASGFFVPRLADPQADRAGRARGAAAAQRRSPSPALRPRRNGRRPASPGSATAPSRTAR